MGSSRTGRVLDRAIARLDPNFWLELRNRRQELDREHATREREDLGLSLHADVCSMVLRRKREAAK